MSDPVVATLRPSPFRRSFALLMLFGLGGLLVYVAFSTPAALSFRVVLLGFGILALWGGVRMERATRAQIELRKSGDVCTTDGVMLAQLHTIRTVDRGAFAFKPSNGFVIHLTQPLGRSWAPGLYWRLGRRVGVGGVTPAAEGKVMAERLQIMLARRDGKLEDVPDGLL